MNYCPLISFRKKYIDEQECMGDNCMFTDAAGECLIKQALQCYVSRERTAAAEREAEERCFLIKKDGTKTPIVFNEETNNYSPLSSGYPHTIEPSSDSITASKSSHDDYWKGLQGGL